MNVVPLCQWADTWKRSLNILIHFDQKEPWQENWLHQALLQQYQLQKRHSWDYPCPSGLSHLHILTEREWEEFWFNLGDRDECVHDGFFLNNVIGSLVVIGVLQLVCFLAKQSLPKSGFHLCVYEVKAKLISWQRIVPVGEHSRASVPALQFGLLQRSDL